jgi:hypothetical protein
MTCLSSEDGESGYLPDLVQESEVDAQSDPAAENRAPPPT